jgi:hypothetical protein
MQPALGLKTAFVTMPGATGQFRRGVGGRAGQRGRRGVGQVECAGGAGVERGVAGERELRHQEQLFVSFLESVPEVSAKLMEPETKERKFEEVVKSAEQAAVLVLVY